jgi:hypothetical protein
MKRRGGESFYRYIPFNIYKKLAETTGAKHDCGDTSGQKADVFEPRSHYMY